MSKLRVVTFAILLLLVVAVGCSSSDQASIDEAVSATLAAAQPATAAPTATSTPEFGEVAATIGSYFDLGDVTATYVAESVELLEQLQYSYQQYSDLVSDFAEKNALSREEENQELLKLAPEIERIERILTEVRIRIESLQPPTECIEYHNSFLKLTDIQIQFLGAVYEITKARFSGQQTEVLEWEFEIGVLNAKGDETNLLMREQMSTCLGES